LFKSIRKTQAHIIMIKFFKYLLATVIGSLLSIVILVLIAVGFVAALTASADQEVTVKSNTILQLKLEGEISERSNEDPFSELLASLSDAPAKEGLNRILQNINKAKRDPNITGILLESGMMNAGYATIEEIRNALIDFKTSGKFVYSYAPVYTQKAYYLASAADKVYLTPGGMLEFKGLFAERTFFKGTLDKLGIEMQIFKHGKFKSAVEPFTLEQMSDASRLQTEVYINSMWDFLVAKIADSRHLTTTQVNDEASKMSLFLGDSAIKQSGLIDSLIYKDELLTLLKTKTNTPEKDDLNAISNAKYAKVYVSKDDDKEYIKEKIAIIYAEGEIDGGGSRDGINSDKLSKTIREARRDSSIKAIVLRINSPGGSALGSEIIWREVKLARQTKPVIVSMGDLAASGGYYIACEADYIVAHPTTLTGSIGIFGLIPNTKGLMDKIGLTFDGVKTNEFADMPSVTRPFRKEEQMMLQAYVEKGYQTFITRCADGRKTSKDSIDAIGQGRVWSGQNALGIHLVDELGGINRAIEVAKEKANLKNYRLVELPEIPDAFEQFIKDMSGDARMFIGKSIMGDDYKHLQLLENLKHSAQIQARMPYNINVY